MPKEVLRSLPIPAPNVNLEVGSGSQGEQMGRILMGIEPVPKNMQPDWSPCVRTYELNVTAALATVRVGVKTAQVQIGLRS